VKRSRPRRLLAATACLVVVLAPLLTACGEEEPLPQDPTDSSLRAGAPAALDAAGVDVVSLDEPSAPTADDVRGALRDAGLDADPLDPSDDSVSDVVSLDPDRLVGGPDLVGDVGDGPYVAVVFTDAEDAWVFAESEPTVFADDSAERDRAAYLAGPVVAFVAGDAGPDRGTDVRRALADLAGVDDSTASPSPSSRASAGP